MLDWIFKNWIFSFLFLGELSSDQSVPATTLNYIEPSYKFSALPSDRYQVEVDVKIGPEDAPEEIMRIREKTLSQEIKKSPLFAMAFIQKLAADGDSQALELQSLYQSYHNFFQNSDKEQILKSCLRITANENAHPLSQNFAKCIEAFLKNEPLDPSLEKAKAMLTSLIPGIEKTLTMARPSKVYEEQEVLIPEMTAYHNAFPDLIKYEGYYYASFREAQSHVGYNDNGKVRVLKGSFDEESHTWKWENVILLSQEGYDLRDPKFFVNQDNSLQIIIGGSKINEKDQTTMLTPHIATLKEGQWSLFEATVDPSANGPIGQWIWRVTWNPYDNHGYALSYGKSTLSLMKTADGIAFEKIADLACEPLSDLSEGTLRFKSDGTAVALIRTRRNGIIATSNCAEGYTKWSMNVIPFRLGGPNFLISQQEMWAGTRHFFINADNSLDEVTIIGCMDEKSLTPLLILKSNLDSSYPGMVLEEDGSVTVIYYSSELEGKCNVYITRIKFSN